jgi:DNA modification methylase
MERNMKIERTAVTKIIIILDLFGGSGSVLIACEQLNRVCYMCELDPKYADVIVKRWEDFTGLRAAKVGD